MTPKLDTWGIVLAGHWMLSQFIGFTVNLFDMIPSLISG